MSIEKLGPGHYRIRWRDAAGRHPSRTLNGNLDQARALERKMMAAADAGELVTIRRSRHTVRSWADTWLAGAHNLREGGRSLYRRDLDRHILPALGDIPLTRLTHDDIDAFLTGRTKAGHAPASVHRYWRTLRRMCNVAVDRDELLRTPMRKVAAPFVPRTEMRFLDAAALEALADAAWTRGREGERLVSYRAMVLVAGWGGLRWSELVGLRPVDIEPGGVRVVRQLIDGSRWEEPKGNAARFVTLPPSVMDLVQPMSPKLVFASPSGQPVNHSNWRQRVFASAKRDAGIDPGFRIHDLRHTAVALAIATGKHPKVIQARMGHSSIQITHDRYGHLLKGMDTDLADDLEEMRGSADG